MSLLGEVKLFIQYDFVYFNKRKIGHWNAAKTKAVFSKSKKKNSSTSVY